MPSRRWRGVHFDFAQCERGGGASALSHILPSVQPERSRRPWESPCGDGVACTSTSLSANGGGERRRDPTVCPPFSLSVVEGHGNPLAEMVGRALRLRSVRTGGGECRRDPTSFPPFSLSVVEGHGIPSRRWRGMHFGLAQCERGGGEPLKGPVPRRRPGPSYDAIEMAPGVAWEAKTDASQTPPMKPSARQRRWGDWAPAFAEEQEAWRRKRAVEPSPDRPSRTANAALTRPRSSARPGRPSR
ncbi:hypothetical protein QE360_001883 [Sphingomonas sp. SORGH_AS789]|nr:hypothetical protein [Sphingomonas sp. SORGH_AS_0789]MDR6151413.1 hypothetical protein [Sphingomonas sp. SORGH_AS_0742]